MSVALRIAGLGIAAFWAAGALAQGAAPAAPGTGWYLGEPAHPATEDTDIGYRHFGGYRFTRNWGVELGYSDLGRGNGVAEPSLLAPQKFGAQTSAWTLAGTGVLPIGEAFSLQGRLGLSVATPDATLSAAGTGAALGSGLNSALPRYRPNVLWGFGGQYDFSNRFGLRVDYNYFGRLEDQGGLRSDLWSINAVVRF